MPSHVSSLVIYNTSADTQATVTADHYLTEDRPDSGENTSTRLAGIGGNGNITYGGTNEYFFVF